MIKDSKIGRFEDSKILILEYWNFRILESILNPRTLKPVFKTLCLCASVPLCLYVAQFNNPCFAQSPVQISSIRYSTTKESVRVVIDLSKETAFTENTINSRTQIRVLLKSALAPDPSLPDIDVKDIVLKSISTEVTTGGTIVVFNLNYPVPYHFFALTQPFRIVADFYKAYFYHAEEWLDNGLFHEERKIGKDFGPLLINVLNADFSKNKNLRLKVVLADPSNLKKRKTLPIIVEQTGALGGINGGYFVMKDGTPVGLWGSEGRIFSSWTFGRTGVGWTKENKPVIGPVTFSGNLKIGEKTIVLHGINRQRKKGELVVYTPIYGETTGTNSAGLEIMVQSEKVVSFASFNTVIPKDGFVISMDPNHEDFANPNMTWKEGAKVSLTFVIEINGKKLLDFIEAGPMLVEIGKVHVTAQEENFKADITQGRAPRSGIGFTIDGCGLLVVVDGRQPLLSRGVTLNEFAELFLQLGAVNAANLDGGGSSSLVFQKNILNNPKELRSIPNAILIFHEK